MGSLIRLEVYPSLDLRRAIDKWRVDQEPVPSRAEATRLLLEGRLTDLGYFVAVGVKDGDCNVE